MQLRRLVATIAVAVLGASSLAACGKDDPTNEGKTEGVYVTTGNLAYQVQISRQLNPADFEDRDYLKGLPPGNTLGSGESYFGVFLRVFNRSDQPQQAARQFTIVDTTGKSFHPVPLNLDQNPVAFRAQVINPGDQNPVPGSVARENSTQGALLLFKIPQATYANRPLVLHITPPSGGGEATVDLDV
jgi:hypothetical protein